MTYVDWIVVASDRLLFVYSVLYIIVRIINKKKIIIVIVISKYS